MKRARAFTLLEVVVALSLFAVGMLSVLSIFPVNRRFLAQSSLTTQASFLAQEKIEEIRALDYSSLTTGTFEARAALGTGSDVFSQFERQTTVSLIDGSWAASGTDVGLKKVDVTVFWTERTVNRQYTISTYVYDK